VEPWDSAGEHDNVAPGAATRRPAASRGQTFLFPAGSPAGSFSSQALRLDGGTWDIRVAHVDAQGHIAPPSKVGALDPYGAWELEISLGVGAVRWVEKTGFSWRGSHLVRTADQIDVRALHTYALVSETRLVVAAQRVVSPAPVATHLESFTWVLGGGNLFFVPVPNGAKRAWIQGPTNALNIDCKWQVSNGATICEFLGQVGGAAPFWNAVPASAAILQVTCIAGGNAAHTVTWEVEV
jgi:hypothetical protein